MGDPFRVAEPHSDFRINNLHFGNEELADVAYSYIKEGEPYEKKIGNFLLDWLNEKDHITVKTSGSTGIPKIVELKKQFMINSALATGKFFHLPAGTTALHCLPSDFIAGRMMLVRAMVLGWKLDLICPKIQCLDEVHKHYDFCAMTPFQLRGALPNLHLIKKIIVGGGAVSQNLKDLIQGIKTEIFETYGMTETVSHIAVRGINSKKIKADPNPFTVLPGVKISADERNCLIIEAPKILKERIVTNDVVEIISKKDFLWLGRWDNVINSGGIKLFPEQIETKLERIIPQRFFVAGIPDDALGEKLILIVEGKPSTDALNNIESEIRDFRLLGKYEDPKNIYFTEKIVETENGKIDRKETLKRLNSK